MGLRLAFLADIHGNLPALEAVVEDLLEISRFDASVMHLDLEEVHLAELIMHAVTASTDADVPVDIDANLAGVVVKADKRRLVRVIANLLDNAAKYGDGATRVQLRKDDDNVLIAVEDNGTGLSGSVRPGNGISGMRERVEALGGRFGAGPLPSRGFRVRAWLPLGSAS